MRNGREGKWKRFFDKLKDPPNWIAVIAIGTGVIVGPLALVTAILGYGSGISAIVAYSICVLVFIYAVVVAVNSVRKARQKVLNVADRYEFTRNLHRDFKFRTAVFAVCALLFNIGYTVFLGVMAVVSRSAWYGALAVYYILLTAARGGVLIQDGKDERKYKYDPTSLQRQKIGTYRYCGIMILALTAALAVSVVEAVASGEGFRVPSWSVYPFIGVAVWKIFTTVGGVVRAMKLEDLATRAAQKINLAAALVAVLSLQTALLSVLAPSYDARVLNALTGGLACLINVGIGVYMLLRAKREKAALDRKSGNGTRLEAYSFGYNRDGYTEEYGNTDKK